MVDRSEVFRLSVDIGRQVGGRQTGNWPMQRNRKTGRR